MKTFISLAFGLLFSVVAGATTLNPVQLLNPAGSTSGQSIISTGPSSAPGWASIVDSVIAGSGIAVSGATGNVTVSLTSPVSVALGGTGAATFTAHGVLVGEGTGAVAVTAPGTLGNLLTSNGSSADPTFQPFSSSSIAGVTNGSNAGAGVVGELITASTSATSAGSGSIVNAATLQLTAGDWDVQCTAEFNQTGGTTGMTANISSISATSAAISSTVGTRSLIQPTQAINAEVDLVTPTVRVNISSSANYFCTAQGNFLSGAMTTAGFARARRVR